MGPRGDWLDGEGACWQGGVCVEFWDGRVGRGEEGVYTRVVCCAEVVQ